MGLTSDENDLLGDFDLPGFQVDVGPPQTDSFSSP